MACWEAESKHHVSFNTAIDEATVMPNGSDDHKLARDMIEVHGTEAATVARENARAAALAGQALQAKSWIKGARDYPAAAGGQDIGSPDHRRPASKLAGRSPRGRLRNRGSQSNSE